MSTRPLVIYHGNCADGFSAAWCFWRKYGANADYLAGVYQRPPPDVAGRDVYLVDFSYKRSVVESMLRSARTVTLIDHHKTALDDLQPLKEQMVVTNGGCISHSAEPNADNFGWFCDLDHSGSMLAWKFLFPDEAPPLLLSHIEDRDLWRFRLPGTREIQAAVFSHEYTFEAWDTLMRANQFDLVKMSAAGTAIERKHHKDVRELVQVCKRRMVIGGTEVWVASLPYTLTSDAGHLMAAGEPFAACYWDTAEGRVFSLRSQDDGVDVSAVAALYGGGGHVHAAGFKVPRNHQLAQA